MILTSLHVWLKSPVRKLHVSCRLHCLFLSKWPTSFIHIAFLTKSWKEILKSTSYVNPTIQRWERYIPTKPFATNFFFCLNFLHFSQESEVSDLKYWNKFFCQVGNNSDSKIYYFCSEVDTGHNLYLAFTLWTLFTHHISFDVLETFIPRYTDCTLYINNIILYWPLSLHVIF